MIVVKTDYLTIVVDEKTSKVTVENRKNPFAAIVITAKDDTLTAVADMRSTAVIDTAGGSPALKVSGWR